MMFRICSILAVVYAFLAAASGQVGVSPDELKLFNLVNQERKKSGLPVLRWNYILAEVARDHGTQMAQHKQLSHQFPGEPLLGDRIGAKALRFNSASENVAKASTAENAHENLMSSPQDKANLLSDKYNELGLAIVPVEGDLYVVEEFAHVLPVYSEGQFSNAVVSAFNKARHANGIGVIDVRSDPRLRKAACAGSDNAQQVLDDLPGATDLVIFTSSVPTKLPSHMQTVAGDATLRRMNIGVCFKPGRKHGFGSFRVVASFYPVD